MRKQIRIVGLVVFMAVLMTAFVVHAGPFLVCDPQSGVSTYELEIDGAIVTSDIPAEPDGSVRYDMVGTSNGTYSLRLRCSNLWGPSIWSVPLAVVVQICGDPQNLMIVE